MLAIFSLHYLAHVTGSSVGSKFAEKCVARFVYKGEVLFEEGLPLAAYPYVQSIGIDPFEFAQKVEGLQQFTGDQQAQPMNEADMQAMNPMAAYGKELVEVQGGTELKQKKLELSSLWSDLGMY